MTDTTTAPPPTGAPPPDADDGPVEMPEGVEVVERPASELEHVDAAGAVEMAGPMGGGEFQNLAAKALVLSRSSLVPKALQGKPHDVLLVLWSARDLGLAETLALRKLYPIDGQVTIAPQLKMALVHMRGAGRIWFDNDNDGTVATVHGQRTGDDYVRTVTVTLAEMQEVRDPKSGKKLVEKPNWKSYPGRMLQWRAVGWLVDDLWPEIALGIYTPDELGAFTDDDGEPLDVESVEVPTGFDAGRRRSSGPDPESPAPDDVKAALDRRIKALPEDERKALAEHWRQGRVPAVSEMTVGKVRRAEALLGAQEAKAKSKGWSPPADDQADQDQAPTAGPGPVEDEPILCGACGCEPCDCAPEGEQDDDAEALAEAAAGEMFPDDESVPHGAEQSDRAPDDDPTRPF